MKKLILISAIAISGLFYNTANAQVRVSFGFNFSPRRVYVPQRVVVARPAPVEYSEPVNYNGDEDYYYIPDVDAYYSVTDQCYFYNNDGDWVSGTYLPGAYRDYDWRSVRHYEVRAPRPYIHNDYYRARYNGVSFNGQWNREYNRGYSNDYRVNHDQYRNDQYRNNQYRNDQYRNNQYRNDQYRNNQYTNDNRRNNNAARNEYRQPNRDDQRFAQRSFPARERDNRGNDRHGR